MYIGELFSKFDFSTYACIHTDLINRLHYFCYELKVDALDVGEKSMQQYWVV